MCSVRNACSICERNNLVQLNATVSTIVPRNERVHNITNLSSRGDEEINALLRQVVLVRRIKLWWTIRLGRPLSVLDIAI